jgi:hypothetical protein
MRLVGRGSSSASKFHGDYGVYSVFVFFSDHGGDARQQMHHATPKHESWAMGSRNLIQQKKARRKRGIGVETAGPVDIQPKLRKIGSDIREARSSI